MRTAFSQRRWEFTKKAHLAAQRQFYPLLYPGGVDYEDVTKTVQDLDYAIDCQLTVNVAGFRAPIRISVQERFRSPSEMHWGDVTVTEWNLATDQPSELHKLGAQMFVYGFYDEAQDRVCLAIAVDVGLMQWALARDEIAYVRQRRGDQSFIGLNFRALKDLGAVLYVHDARAIAPEEWPEVRRPPDSRGVA